MSDETKTVLNEIQLFSPLADAKCRGRVRERLYPESQKQQHKVNTESRCRAEDAAMLWITEKGKPPLNAQVGLRGILLNHHKSLAALLEFIFVLQRLHSRWLLCFIQRNAQILSESVTVTQSEAHILLCPVWAKTKDCIIFNTMFLYSSKQLFISWLLPMIFRLKDGSCGAFSLS